VLFLKAPEVKVIEDVPQQNQPAKRGRLQQIEGVAGAADLRTQVNIRQYERVEWPLHALILLQLAEAKV